MCIEKAEYFAFQNCIYNFISIVDNFADFKTTGADHTFTAKSPVVKSKKRLSMTTYNHKDLLDHRYRKTTKMMKETESKSVITRVDDPGLFAKKKKRRSRDFVETIKMTDILKPGVSILKKFGLPTEILEEKKEEKKVRIFLFYVSNLI